MVVLAGASISGGGGALAFLGMALTGVVLLALALRCALVVVAYVLAGSVLVEGCPGSSRGRRSNCAKKVSHSHVVMSQDGLAIDSRWFHTVLASVGVSRGWPW